MQQRFMRRVLTMGLALWMSQRMLPVQVAQAETTMTFRLSTTETTVQASALEAEDVVLRGYLYIDDYTSLTALKVSLGSDAPLVIENGGFSEPAFFAAHGMGTTYTQHSEATGLSNICCWNGPGGLVESPGVVANPGGSLLTFDVRIPQGTAPGAYRLFLKDEVVISEAGKQIPSFYAYNDSEELTPTLQACTVVVTAGAVRGDVDGDGAIDADDATRVLRYYVGGLTGIPADEQLALLETPDLQKAYEAADVNLDGKRDSVDATCILQYYVVRLTGKEPDWTTICGG